MISIPKHLSERANVISDSTHFPIPQSLVLRAIGLIEEYRTKALANPDSLFYPCEIRKLTSLLYEYGLDSEPAIAQYLDMVEATIASYRQRLNTLQHQYACQQREYYAAFEREEALRRRFDELRYSRPGG
jgi:hypothetical protein